MNPTARTHALSRIATQFLTGGLILLFLVFISVPLVSLFTRVSVGDLLYAITSEAAINALTLSAATAVLSTVIVIIFGTPLAYVNARIPYKGRNIVDTLTDLPIVLPPTVAGLALLMAFGANGLLGQYFSIFGIKSHSQLRQSSLPRSLLPRRFIFGRHAPVSKRSMLNMNMHPERLEQGL